MKLTLTISTLLAVVTKGIQLNTEEPFVVINVSAPGDDTPWGGPDEMEAEDASASETSETSETSAEAAEIVEVKDEYGLCECIDSHGQTVFTDDSDNGFIVLAAVQYPADYGLNQCNAWDEGKYPYCDTNQNEACEKSWCFVDENCTASDMRESPLIDGLYFSYNNCAMLEVATEDEAAADEGAVDGDASTEQDETEQGDETTDADANTDGNADGDAADADAGTADEDASGDTADADA